MCLVLNTFLLIYYVSGFKRNALFPLFTLLLGLPFIFISFSVSSSDQAEKTFSILSFNSKLFREEDTYDEFSEEMIDWVINDSSSIKCIQEFCTNPKWPGLDVYGEIERSGYNGYSFASKTIHNQGLAIFTKFPIVNSGTLFQRKLTVNNIIFADIKINEDTLRVYNCHLSSMNIILYEYKSLKEPKSKAKKLISKLREGGISRSKEIDVLLAHASQSPHPVLICGDFNEIPYSFNYFRFKELYSNSFEEAGNGFGFTLNNALFFLRIDHQFYGNGIEAKRYEVDKSMRISDHFPTRGWYRFD